MDVRVELWRKLNTEDDAFELWCWRRLLRVPWTARRSHQFILKEISPGCSSSGLVLKLKLQYFGHLMWRADSFEKTMMLGNIKDRRRRGWQRVKWWDDRGWSGWMTSPTQWTWVWVNSWSWLELVMDREAWRPVVHGVTKRHDWATELNWTLNVIISAINFFTGLILLSNGVLRIILSITVWKHWLFGAQPTLWSNCHNHPWLLEIS